MIRRPVLLVTVATVALLAAACGKSDDSTMAGSDHSTKTIDIAMQAERYVPNEVLVADGETVRFHFTNDDTVTHEAFLGDAAAQTAHESEMGSSASETGSMSGMGGHDMEGGDAITLAPGKAGDITHTFHKGDELLIGCHEPGHYASGMKLVVTVR